MLRLSTTLAIPAGLLSLVGCTERSSSIKTMPSNPKTVSISNGVVDLVINPKIGRVTRYGFVGCPNLLWTNTLADINSAGWLNYGGEKLWIWPQDDWKQVTGKAWPPPMDVPPANVYDVEVRGRSIVMRSAVIEKYGVRIVREIHLADTGTDVEIRSRFEPVAGGPPRLIAAWSVAQVPASARILVPRDAVPSTFPSTPPATTTRPTSFSVVDDNWWSVTPTDESSKYFFATNTIVAEFPDGTRFRHTCTVPSSPSDAVPQERAQVYLEGSASRDTIGREQYTEIEFVGSHGRNTDGAFGELTTRWQLEK
jgi:hypothetical protein